MMKKVKFIDLVLENCEAARLTPDMFRGLYIGGITRDLDVNCAQYENGEIGEYLRCKTFSIIINKKGLLEAKMHPDFGDSISLKDRLRHKDITHVDVIFSMKGKWPKEHEYISVPWYLPKDYEGREMDKYDWTNYYQEHIWGANEDRYLKEDEMLIQIEASESGRRSAEDSD
ncbi:MAG: hypothetical protein PHW73_04140 [Atribacterota bacterium]|nr:hypothetical protein [Atribacterota bacterium]